MKYHRYFNLPRRVLVIFFFVSGFSVLSSASNINVTNYELFSRFGVDGEWSPRWSARSSDMSNWGDLIALMVLAN